MAQQHILGLQVPVHDASCLVEVLDGIKHLCEIVTCEFLGEASTLVLPLDEGEEVSLLDEFEHNEENLDAFARLLNDSFSIAVVVDQLYNVGVFNLLQESHLVVEDLLERGQTDALDVVSLDDLDRQELA